MAIYSIYKITNKINNKVYIGFTSNTMEKRWYDHIANAKSNKRNKKKKSAIQDAILKYGEDNFTREIIYQSADKEHTLNNMENYFITEYNSYNEGYNLTEGGDCPDFTGRSHTAETKEKLREYFTGKSFSTDYHKQRVTESNKTRDFVWSEESRKRASDAAKNREKKECPYCGKKATPAMFSRWHGDNCKKA